MRTMLVTALLGVMGLVVFFGLSCLVGLLLRMLVNAFSRRLRIEPKAWFDVALDGFVAMAVLLALSAGAWAIGLALRVILHL